MTGDFDYTDTTNFASSGKVACLLCQRQFKSEEMLRKHNAQSDLHKARITFQPEPRGWFRPERGTDITSLFFISIPA